MNELINAASATIVDVRSEGEFSMGHVEGSMNIPLDQVPGRVDDFKEMSKPIIVCCASGNRSGQAQMFLQQQGVTEIYNGGGWADVQMHIM